MFYEVAVKSHIRVPPAIFAEDTEKSVLEQLNSQFEGFVSKDLGVVIGVIGVKNIGEGVIIPGDGAAYYDTTFNLITYKPELQELVVGKVTDISDFGAFVEIGPLDGMVHVSQTMDDFVSFSKSNVLSGKQSKRTLKIGDTCRARVIAVSYKDLHNPKIGLTMRQPFLGKLEWIQEDAAKKVGKPEEDKKATKGKTKK
jgi:DNA-directed RNA polymerase subunit E'|tara:strand:+ start:38767 stop:39360 length:594 start_codon:yes stop_codon:yes gene_type:complete